MPWDPPRGHFSLKSIGFMCVSGGGDAKTIIFITFGAPKVVPKGCAAGAKKPGSARLGSVRLGSARLGPGRLNFPPPGGGLWRTPGSAPGEGPEAQLIKNDRFYKLFGVADAKYTAKTMLLQLFGV